MDDMFVRFENSPDGPREVFLCRDTFFTKGGFGLQASTYPVTVCPARYNGTYEGAPWLAFPVAPHILSGDLWRDWGGNDIECMMWWERARKMAWPIGRGATPDLAYQNLINLAAEKAGINPDGWSAEPTWDRDELRRRDGEDHP